MRTLKVGFSKPRSKWAVISHLIRLIERSSFSHALLRWYSPSVQTDMVYQASHGMVHFLSGERFDSSAETMIEYELSVSDEQHTHVMSKCVRLAGVKYGTLQLIGMGLEKLTGIRNPFRDGPLTYVCSELIGEIIQELYDIKLDLESIGPKQLEVVVRGLPGVIRSK